MRPHLLLPLAVLLSACGSARPTAPHTGDKPATRTVVANALVSDALPDARVSVPEGARFIGSTRFDLYDAADTEIYLFAEAGPDRVVDRLYWIQLESYLPSVPNAGYEPGRRGEPLAALGEMDLYYRARFGSREDEMPEGSEAERVLAMVRDAGYTLPAETMSAQFHQTVSDDDRSEILVIYVEDLTAVGLTVGEILAGGREGEPMRQLTARALPRAQERVRIGR